MRSVHSGPWNKGMAVALVGSIAACVLLATRVEATAPPGSRDRAGRSDLDCSDFNLRFAKLEIANFQRAAALGAGSVVPEIPATTNLEEIRSALELHARWEEWTTFRTTKVIESRAALAACHVPTQVDLCFGFNPAEFESELAHMREQPGGVWLAPGARNWLIDAYRELELCQKSAAR